MKRHHWNRYTVLLALTALAVSVVAATAAQASGPSINAGPKAGIVWERAQQKGKPSRGGNPDLIYHSGPVMTSAAAVTPIFWGTSWNPNTGDKISGIESFYGGLGGSQYASTNTEYTQTGGAHVSSSAAGSTSLVDNSAAPSRAPATSAILAEVAKKISNPVSNGYYPVYIDQPRGHAGYCAWHSAGTVNGVTVQFAFFFNLDGDSGCDPQSTLNHSQGLSALANVSGHEFSEMMTDPQLNAWYDSQGAENSDKCAWTFGSSSLTFKNGSQWKIQGNWSNAAYDSNQGYTSNGTRIRGCID
jgi:hypothetical protein